MRFRVGLILGLLAGVATASFLTGYIGAFERDRERKKLAVEVRKCPGDTVVLESGLRVCKTGLFRVVPRRAA